MLGESNDGSNENKLYIVITDFNEDLRLVKKTTFWKSPSERFLHDLISFHWLPYSTDEIEIFRFST